MHEQVIVGTRTFRVIDCFKCGVEFAVPRSLDETCHRDKQEFYCPNGHGQHYTTSLRDTIVKLQSDLADALTARDRLEVKLRRVDAGVCPNCNRSFRNLHRHMQSKHKKG